MNARIALRRVAPIASALACALVLAACGQKGPLYLPDEGASPVRTSPNRPADGAATTTDRNNETRKQIH